MRTHCRHHHRSQWLLQLQHPLLGGTDNDQTVSTTSGSTSCSSVPLPSNTTTTGAVATAEPQTKESSRTYLCCLFNARSVVNKLYELQQLLYVEKYDLVFITETWLHSDITNGLLDPWGIYTVYRKDRYGSQPFLCTEICTLLRLLLTIRSIV